MRKIGLNFWVNSDLSQILTAIELGCDYLEICLEFPFFLKKNNVWLLKTAKENGLELAFESPQGAVQMFNPIPQISKVSVKIMKKMLHFSSKFDPLYFNFHQVIDIPTYNILENKIEKRKVEVVKELSKIVDFPLTFENIARKSLSTPEQFSFIKKFDNVFLCLDVGHLPQASHIWKREIELEDWLKSFKNKILTLHLHNVKKYKGMFYDHMTFSSRGLIDLKKVLKKTEGVRFILLETFYLDVEKNPVDKITLSRDLEKIRMFYKEKKRNLHTSNIYSDEFYKIYEEKHSNIVNLKRSIFFFEKMDKLRQHLSQLKGKKARCLIEGFACPYNAGYLHEFLKKFKIEPTIFVIDINERGYKNAKLKKVDRFIKKFVKTDAINTGFKNNIFDFVIQDFLLNCSPFHLHDKIIKEVFRVLKPNGVFLTSYSYLNSFPKVPLFKQEIIEKNYQIELEKLLSFRENMKTKFKQKFIQCPEGFIFITSTGDFEFYRKRKSFKNIFKKYFEALDKKIEIAKDRNGLLCERWREVYKKSKLK